MRRPSVVLDTNVVVSAHLNRDGFEAFVLNLALARRIKLYISAEILEEYGDVLEREKFDLAPDLITASLHLIDKNSSRIKPRQHVLAASDPDDDKFLECAQAADADYLITGNKRHFPERWKKTRVVNAREFLLDVIPRLTRNG